MTEAAAEVSRTTVKNEDDDLPHEDAPGEATLLVSEFPPPPFYYPLADQLEPPPIPTEAVKNGTERAARVLAEARAEAERQRLGADTTNAILGGTVSQEDDENVVAVFGEVVEDPRLVQPLDLCEDPTVVREEVKRLNATVLHLFAQLAHDLVHRPLENKYVFAYLLNLLSFEWLICMICTCGALIFLDSVQKNTRRVIAQYIFNATRMQ
jgi:mediator of RNA polymerase II transcription subunit 7